MSTPTAPTVGVLFPGEMGAAVASLLRGRGTTVVTTAHGRSGATAERCVASGATVVDSLAEVVRRSDVLIALVVPDAAEDVARQYCAAAHLAPPGAIYVDGNSIGPARVAAIGRRVEAAGRAFVDGSINGLAKNLPASGTLYLSGRRAAEVARLFEGATRVKLLGDEVGRASAMKMLLGGLSKGVCALFAELAVVAEGHGLLEEMLEATRRTYGGVTAVAERMLPTYPRHAARRYSEMSELEATARGVGLTPRVIDGVVQFHEMLAQVMPAGEQPATPAGAEQGDLTALIRLLAERMNAPEVV